MTRAAIYARFSSDLQSDASIEDQIRTAREYAKRQGWEISDARIYADHAISGASMMRPGLQMLMLDAQTGKFDVVLAEALDRISRDQADVATIRKRLLFADVSMHTLSEGEISELHIGLKGTMNALFLKDLAIKTRRGQRGRVENGKSGGGLPFGYKVVGRGEFEVDEHEAAIVRRIFEEYAAGASPKKIAANLNRDGIRNASGMGWSQSTLNGNRQRGTGVLNNEIYIGRRIWNRTRKVKSPDSGVRLSRPNPPGEWIINDVPELRIIDQALWDAVKDRQTRLTHTSTLWEKRRPTNLLSFLLRCGECGGGYAKASASQYGCSFARNKGTCGNRLTISQDKLEGAVLAALHSHLMDPALCEEFTREYVAHSNRLRMEHNASLSAWRAEREKLQTRRNRIVDAIGNGFANEDLKNEYNTLIARRDELDRLLETTPEAPVLLHPNMSEKYRREVQALTQLLADGDRKMEAAEILRSLIEKIVLTPTPDRRELVVDLFGDLAGIINLAASSGKACAHGSGVATMPSATLSALNHFRLEMLKMQTAQGDAMPMVAASAASNSWLPE